MKIKRIIAFLVCLALAFSALCVTALADDTDVIDGVYKQIAKNEHNALYLDEATGNIAVRNTATGTVWYSSPDAKDDKNTTGIEKTNIRSPLVFEYFYADSEVSIDKTGLEVSNTASECDESDITVESIENGAKVTFSVPYLEITVSVEYVLDGESFKASILYDEFQEGEYIKMVSMKLLPGFGAAGMNEKGYLVVPDGSGAVINFNNGSGASEYSATVYGDEIDTLTYTDVTKEKAVRMPIFGIVKENGALLGVITEGDDSAAISAYSSYVKKYGYNTAASKAIYRMDSQLSMFTNDFANHNTINNWCKSATSDRYTVSYYFLGKADASYQGIAQAYQNHLVNEGVLEERAVEPSMHLDVYGSIQKTTAFLGFKYQKQVSLTTYAQTKEILSELKEEGINDLSARLIGAFGTGVDNKKLPTKVKYISVLGGKRNFKKLVAFAEDEGIALTADTDFVYAAKISRKNALQTYHNKLKYKYLYRNSVYTERRDTKLMVASALTMLSTAEKYVKSFKKTGVSGISFSTLAADCHTSFTPKNAQSRRDWIENTKKALAAYGDYTVTLNDANAYTFAYADVITRAPMASSGYELFDYDIPLYQLVLKGYITVTTDSLPQTVDEERAYLLAVTTGTEPLYNTFYEDADILQESEYDYLYSSTFTLWKDEAIEKYKKYGALLKAVHGAKITGYTESADVVKTKYENGVTVYVNYGDSAVTVDGKKINAKDYVWTGGDKNEA